VECAERRSRSGAWRRESPAKTWRREIARRANFTLLENVETDAPPLQNTERERADKHRRYFNDVLGCPVLSKYEGGREIGWRAGVREIQEGVKLDGVRECVKFRRA
jgi:hypothetical protein